MPRITTAPSGRRVPALSLRLLVTLIVVIPAAIVSLALLSIATLTSRSIAEELGHEIVAGSTQRVISDVDNYFRAAMRLSDHYVRRIKDGTLSTTDLASWETTMFQDLAANPDVASICFANPRGDCTWLLRAHGRLELGIVRGDAMDQAVEWAADETGQVNRETPLRIYEYNALKRPWYETATRIGGAIWTDIYNWFPGESDASVIGTGYTRQVYDENANVLGVLIIDVTLAALSERLMSTAPTRNHTGHTFIVDEKRLLVAASEAQVCGPDGQRLTPEASASPAARAVAPLVNDTVRGLGDTMLQPQGRRIMINGEPARARITEIRPAAGIHWHVVTILKESAFLSQATLLQTRSILLAAAAIIGGLAVGLLLSRRLSHPLLRITQHVARVGAGDFETQLHVSDAAELQNLSDELNRMARGLKHRMMLEQSLVVAEQIQQSLLPAAAPKAPGLEIAGSSRFCEATGGDYYDFIPIGDLAHPRMLVAVGDVTGHGIGAALLMATARGAVRTGSIGAPSIGHILGRVNQVLNGSVNNGMFMTLVLVAVDPLAGTIHWSSAGHDPVIVYHPQSDAFEDLVGGDVPLGIDADTVYREFSRSCALPGSVIVIGTDGIWEARNSRREMFGKQRLRQTIRASAAGSAAKVAEAIHGALDEFLEGAALQDDVTFVVIKT